jgi:tetratricopeptide (TPR) repeat protein
LDQNKFESFCNLGNVYDNLGMKEDAIAAFERAIDLDPTDLYPYLSAAVLCTGLGKYERTITFCTRAIDSGFEDSEAYAICGDAKKELAKRNKNTQLLNSALRDLNKAIDLEPNASTNYLWRAEIHELLGQPDAATADLRRAEEIQAATGQDQASAG